MQEARGSPKLAVVSLRVLEGWRNEKWWQGFEPEWVGMPFTESPAGGGMGKPERGP